MKVNSFAVSDAMPEWLQRRAALSPQRLGLIGDGVRITFAAWDAWAAAVAQRLQAAGVKRGDRVALLARNSLAYAAWVYGVSRAGAILVPLNIRLTASELEWPLTDAGVRLLVYDPELSATVSELARRCPQVPRLSLGPDGVGDDPVAGVPVPRPAPTGKGDAPAHHGTGGFAGAGWSFRTNDERTIRLSDIHSIVYTSGTTGRPKGACLTYGNHWWSAIGSTLNLGLHEEDRWLACLPLFHVGGLSILIRGVIYGIPAIVHRAFDPAAVNRAIDEEGVTIISVVSVMLQRMLDDRGRRPYPPTLRCVLVGGGPVPRPLLEDCARRKIPVVQTYGMTETASQVATLSPADALRKLGSAGKPLFPTRLRIVRTRATDGPVDERRDSEPEPAAPGEVGEIAVAGPTVTPGYWGRPRETEKNLHGGWLYTGDMGYVDEDGYLYVVERRTDLIISGGENVYPAEVEAVLLRHPAVAEAGVVGVPDERWGQAVAAAITLRRGAAVDADELKAFCRRYLAGYKVPAHIRVVESLPRNAAGKLLRRELRALFTSGGVTAAGGAGGESGEELS